MEKTLTPDKKYFKANFWIHLTIFVSLLVITGLISLIVNITKGDLMVIRIIWLVSLGLSFILWTIIFPLVILWIKKLSYHIGEERITISHGIITKTQQNIPYSAITDFALKRGPYDRILGIGSIKIQTAGQLHNPTGYEGSLSGLLDYNNLITELRTKIKSLHSGPEVTISNTSNTSTGQNILEQILSELKEIRKSLEK